MDAGQFNDGLLAAYRGERAAAVTLHCLCDLGLSEQERSLAELFAAVETAVGDRLEPLLRRRGLPVGLDARQIEAARARARALGSWPAVVESLGERLDGQVREFRALRNSAPPADRHAFDLLVDHEIALMRFGAMLRQGRVEEARSVLGPLAHGTGVASGPTALK